MRRGPREFLQPALVLSFALLTVLAGCTGGLPGVDAGSAPYDTPLNATEVSARHADALRAGGSFTVAYEATSNVSGTRRTATVTAAVDAESGATSYVQNGTGPRVEGYVGDDGAGFARVGSGEDVRYVRLDGGDDAVPTDGFFDLGLTDAVSRLNFTTGGTRQVAGDRTWVYEATAPETAPPAAGDLRLSANVTVRLFVTADGLVRRMEVTATGTEGTAGDDPWTLSSVVTYTDVGATEVTEPAWLDEARNRTA